MKETVKNKFKQLGKNIVNQRIKHGITIDELAMKSGIRKQYLIKIEQGISYRMSVSHLEKLAKGLDISLKEILKNL